MCATPVSCAILAVRCQFFFFSSRRRHTRYWRDWSSDVCSSDLLDAEVASQRIQRRGDVEAAAVGINPATLNALAGNFGIKIVADTATQFPGFPLNVRSERGRGGEEGRSRGSPVH